MKKSIISLLLLHFLAYLSQGLFAQFNIIYNDITVSGEADNTFGSGLSYFDFDKDGWDDLTVCDANQPIRLYLNNHYDEFVPFATIANTLKAKQPTWVDFDNDNDYDLFITYHKNSCKLYRNDGNLCNLVDATANLNLPSAIANSYGCAWADYDKDGFLDVHICNYQIPGFIDDSWLLHNQGDGTFTNATAALNTPYSINTPFQSAWADFDLNGWPDLYITYDHLFPSKLYLNYGGLFTNVSATSGADIELMGMSNSIADYDQDGDFDIYVSGDSQGNMLLKNTNANFEEVAVDNNSVLYLNCWNTLWLDVNNDGYEDLHVCVSDGYVNNKILMNDTQGAFVVSNLSNGALYNRSFCSAKGDINNDGHVDFCTYSQVPAKVTTYKNTGSNRWIKIGLTGTVSNKDGIGAILQIHRNGHGYTHQTNCGSNYLTQDSHSQIIGAASSITIDSLLVYWPSGWVDKFYDLATNQSYNLVEGETAPMPTNQTEQISFCDGENVVLDPGIFTNYNWNNGSDEQTIIAESSGIYSVDVTNEFGYTATYTFEVSTSPTTIISTTTTSPNCYDSSDGNIVIEVLEGAIQEIVWNNDAALNSFVLDNIEAGVHNYQLMDAYGCLYTGAIELQGPSPIIILSEIPSACYGESVSASLLATGGNGPLSIDWNGANPEELYAGSYPLAVTDSAGCLLLYNAIVEQNENINIAINAPLACYNESVSASALVTGGAGNFQLDWNGENPDAIYAGEYVLSVIDANNCAASQNFSILQSTNIEITTSITNPNNGANGSVILDVEGGYAPYTYLWNNNNETNVLSDAPQGSFSCTITDALFCTQNIEVSLIDLHVSEQQQLMVCFPNPFSDKILIRSKTVEQIMVYDTIGQLVHTQKTSTLEIHIDTTFWNSGPYLIKSGSTILPVIKL